ncbi:MAG: hypothetical protein ACOYJ2_03385 [Rickettsiales bacterium]
MINEVTASIFGFFLLIGFLAWFRWRALHYVRGLRAIESGEGMVATATVLSRNRLSSNTSSKRLCSYEYTTQDGTWYRSLRARKFALMGANRGDLIEVIYWQRNPKIHTLRDALNYDIHTNEQDARASTMALYAFGLLAFLGVGYQIFANSN